MSSIDDAQVNIRWLVQQVAEVFNPSIFYLVRSSEEFTVFGLNRMGTSGSRAIDGIEGSIKLSVVLLLRVQLCLLSFAPKPVILQLSDPNNDYQAYNNDDYSLRIDNNDYQAYNNDDYSLHIDNNDYQAYDSDGHSLRIDHKEYQVYDSDDYCVRIDNINYYIYDNDMMAACAAMLMIKILNDFCVQCVRCSTFFFF